MTHRATKRKSKHSSIHNIHSRRSCASNFCINRGFVQREFYFVSMRRQQSHVSNGHHQRYSIVLDNSIYHHQQLDVVFVAVVLITCSTRSL